MTSVRSALSLKNRNTSRNVPSKYARSTPQVLVRNQLRRTTAPRTCLSENLLFPTMRHFPKDFIDRFALCVRFFWRVAASLSAFQVVSKLCPSRDSSSACCLCNLFRYKDKCTSNSVALLSLDISISLPACNIRFSPKKYRMWLC